MKNFKKVIATALTAVMMMAMSVTAFAAPATATEATGGASIKVTNISERDAKTLLSLYQVAYIDTAKNEVVINKWAEEAYNESLESQFDATALKLACEKAKITPKTKESVNGAEVIFDSLEAGVYMIVATGSTVQYNPMVVVTYTTDDKGTYIATKEPISIKAKGSSNTVEKTDDDGLVRAGQKVNFTLKSTVPYMANKTNTEFKVFDKEKNLSKPENVKVTVGGEEMAAFKFDEGVKKGEYVLYTMDLSSLVDSCNDDKYAGMTVVITYTATVEGPNGFVNQAYDSTYKLDENGDPEKTPPTVVGYPADITLVKVAEDKETVLKGAEFEVTKNGKSDLLNFVKVSEGVYEYSETATAATTTTIAAPEGTVKITGLDEGTYHFAETKAPKGYSINTKGVDVVIQDLSEELTNNSEPLTKEQKELLSREGKMIDTKLSSLPFTGGIGTTIFTVLGVAMMIAASALYFATKKKTSVN